jgi:hypothetical protein
MVTINGQKWQKSTKPLLMNVMGWVDLPCNDRVMFSVGAAIAIDSCGGQMDNNPIYPFSSSTSFHSWMHVI